MLQERTQTGSLCYKKEHKLEVYATIKNTNWKFMLQERTQTGSLCYEKEHKLEVYATIKHTNWKFMLQERTQSVHWKFMLQERTQTGSLCYNKAHKLEVYATIKHTNWKFMLQERTQTGSLCYDKAHKLEVYATKEHKLNATHKLEVYATRKNTQCWGPLKMQQLLERIAEHLQINPAAIRVEPILHGTQQKRNVYRLKIGTESYLLKQHDITTPVVKTGYTPFQIESAVLSTLYRNGCPVPRIIWQSELDHVLLLAWCGELTLDTLAQKHPIADIQSILHTILTELCRIETVFSENARQFKPYIFRSEPNANLHRVLEQGKKTVSYLAHLSGTALTPSEAEQLDTAWTSLSRRLQDAPLTLNSLDYQARNITIAGENPFFIDFGSVGWDWPEQRLTQFFNSIGANQAGANFVSLLNRELVNRYAEWVTTHRETCSPADIAARVDGHHLLFYLSIIHRLLKAIARPDTLESRVLLTAWGDVKERFQQALTVIIRNRLSDDADITDIRQMIATFQNAHP